MTHIGSDQCINQSLGQGDDEGSVDRQDVDREGRHEKPGTQSTTVVTVLEEERLAASGPFGVGHHQSPG